MTDIIRDTIDGPARTGSKVVGTSSVQFGDEGDLFTGVTIKADAGNAGIVYVGFNAGVTAGTVAASDGFPLAAGEDAHLSVTNMQKIFVIASQATQKFFWIAQ